MPSAFAQPVQTPLEVVGEGPEVHGTGPHEVRSLGLGQQRQLVDQSGHPVELVEHERADVLDLGGVSAVEQLDVATHDGDRRTQLVARVVEEAPLRGERPFDPVEHRVERPCQRRDVIRPGHLDPPAEVGLADLLCRLPDEPDRGEQGTSTWSGRTALTTTWAYSRSLHAR